MALLKDGTRIYGTLFANTEVVIGSMNVASQINAAFNQANTSNIKSQAAFDAANTAASNTIFLQSINNTQNANISSTNSYAQGAYNKANTADVKAQAAFDKANTGTSSSTDQYARDTANTSVANTVIIQGVDLTQNTNITAVNTYATSGYGQANIATTLAQAAFDKANNSISADQYARDTANASFIKANSATLLAQAAFDRANTSSSSGIDQYARNTANSATSSIGTIQGDIGNILGSISNIQGDVSAIQGVDTQQNTNITIVTTLAQAAFDAANTGGGGGGGTLDQYARTTANSASVTAQAAFNRANTGVASPVQVDDLSFQFDGIKKSFTLTTDGTSLSPSNPNNLQVFVGGIQVFPTKYAYDYFNLPEISVFNSGFKLSGNTITFATAPSRNMNFYGLSRSEITGSFNYKQTPFSALNIMLGS